MDSVKNVAYSLLFLVLFAEVARGTDPTIMPGENPAALTFGCFKLTGLVNPEGLEGAEGSLGSGIVPNEREFDFFGGIACNGLPTIGTWNDSTHVALRYCGSTGSLNARVDASPSYCMDARIGIAPVVNYIQIEIAERATGTNVRYTNVVLSTREKRIPLGNFQGAGSVSWHVQGIDLSSGFCLEGDLILGWPANPATIGQDTNRFVVKIGSIPDVATASVGENRESVGKATAAIALR
jgi:hypothetical protein